MEFRQTLTSLSLKELLDQLERIFGVEERLLEEVQLNGSEAEFNKDIVFMAYEDEVLLGAIHATIPHKTPYLAGLSAMFTTEAARGKGLGKLLFGKIVEEVSRQGVRLTLLGTSNPIAAKLYAQFGFAFHPGSHVMTRFSQGAMVDLTRDYYAKMQGAATVSRGDASMRIPLIPLALQTEQGLILDINTAILNSSTVTQRSCMGLFPRYLALRERGGDYFSAFDEAGTLGAVGSVAPQPDGAFRADLFALPAFESVIPEMIRKMEEAFGSIYFEIACGDTAKARLLKENGFRPTAESHFTAGDLTLQTVKYTN